MGEVYRARDTRLNRTVAIKVLSARLTEDASFRKRFEREARAIAGLEHPNICPLYDVGDQDGTSFLVMQHLQGETLATHLKRGPLPIESAIPGHEPIPTQCLPHGLFEPPGDESDVDIAKRPLCRSRYQVRI
jgi:serine/threonine protein kinase